MIKVSPEPAEALVRQAQCCCGQTTITVKGDPVVHGICHCDDCKRRTGSAFGWSAYFSDEHVLAVQGETVVYTVTGRIAQTRHFCAHCGSTVCWISASFENMTGVAGGCFDRETLPAPVLSLTTENKCLWLTLPSGCEVH